MARALYGQGHPQIQAALSGWEEIFEALHTSFMASGQVEAAMQLLLEGLEISRESGNREVHLKLLFVAARIEDFLHRRDAAVAHAQEALDILESVGGRSHPGY